MIRRQRVSLLLLELCIVYFGILILSNCEDSLSLWNWGRKIGETLNTAYNEKGKTNEWIGTQTGFHITFFGPVSKILLVHKKILLSHKNLARQYVLRESSPGLYTLSASRGFRIGMTVFRPLHFNAVVLRTTDKQMNAMRWVQYQNSILEHYSATTLDS